MLDGREHGGIITADGRQVPEARAVYTRVLTAANIPGSVAEDPGAKVTRTAPPPSS